MGLYHDMPDMLEYTLILLLSVLTLQITIMDNINDIVYIFLFTLCYISIIPFTSIFHTITIFTNHIVYYINELCYLINRHPRLYPYLHTINIIHLVILRFNDFLAYMYSYVLQYIATRGLVLHLMTHVCVFLF